MVLHNNDVLRRLRYSFELGDDKMIEIFGLGSLEVSRAQVSNWLKKDDDDSFIEIDDVSLASFLNGFIIKRRGKRDGPERKPETVLNNNIILRKLKIALDLKDVDVLSIMEGVDFRMSKHELSAFFRKEGQRQYRACKDQIFRNFLMGVQKKYRP